MLDGDALRAERRVLRGDVDPAGVAVVITVVGDPVVARSE